MILHSVLAILVLTSVGCATTSSPQETKTVTDLKQVAGSWNGWIVCHECPTRLRANLSIEDDGHWKMVIERNPTFYSDVGLVDGVLRWGQGIALGRPWYGTVTLVEKRGREWLTFLRPMARSGPSSTVRSDNRLATLRAPLGFLAVTPAAPELQLLHRWLDTWNGIGLIAVGMHRQGLRLSLSHIAEGEWRARFGADVRLSDAGYDVAPAPWGALQMAAWGAINPNAASR